MKTKPKRARLFQEKIKDRTKLKKSWWKEQSGGVGIKLKENIGGIIGHICYMHSMKSAIILKSSHRIQQPKEV